MCFAYEIDRTVQMYAVIIHPINRYTPPASTLTTPFSSNSKSNALIRFTGIFVFTTNVFICSPSGTFFNRFTICSSVSLRSGNSSLCTAFAAFEATQSHPIASTKSFAEVMRTAWFVLIRLLHPMEYSSLQRPGKAKQSR